MTCPTCALCNNLHGGQRTHGTVTASYHNKKVHLDIADCGVECPVAPYYGCRLALIIVDVYTGMIITVPIVNKTAITVRNAFRTQYIDNYGAPYEVHTDGGTEFQGIFHKYLDEINTIHTISPVGKHNGVLAENAISRIWTALRTELTDRNLQPKYAMLFMTSVAQKLNTRVQHSKGKSALNCFATQITLTGLPDHTYTMH